MATAYATLRLELVPVGAADADAIVALLRHPDVRRYLCDNALVPHAVVEGWVAESRDPRSGTTYWRIAPIEDASAAIGLVGLRPPMAAMLALRNIGWRSREMLIALDPAHWGRGLASEAVEAIAAEAGSDGVTFALLSGVDEPNARSHRLMRRSGFHELGRIAGPVHPLTVYERAV